MSDPSDAQAESEAMVTHTTFFSPKTVSPNESFYQPIHAGRKVKTYPIQEHEMDMLSSMNRNSMIWFTAMSMALTGLLACVWDVLPSGQDGAWGFTPQRLFFMALLGAVSYACYHFGTMFQRERSSLIEKIKSESNFNE